MDRLIQDAWHLYHTAAGDVVKPSIPVLYFGNYERYIHSPWKVVTVGKNPSGNEFPAHDRFHRFARARAIYPAILDGKFYEEYLLALNNYFRTDTELKWFDRSYEPVLRGAGWSFSDSGQSVALHTDICSPLATIRPWRDVDPVFKHQAELLGLQLWQRLINHLAPDVIIASVAQAHREKIHPLPLHEWENLYTVARTNPYEVKTTSLVLSIGKRVQVFYGRDAVTPFQLVSDREKEQIGRAIRTYIERDGVRW